MHLPSFTHGGNSMQNHNNESFQKFRNALPSYFQTHFHRDLLPIIFSYYSSLRHIRLLTEPASLKNPYLMTRLEEKNDLLRLTENNHFQQLGVTQANIHFWIQSAPEIQRFLQRVHSYPEGWIFKISNEEKEDEEAPLINNVALARNESEDEKIIASLKRVSARYSLAKKLLVFTMNQKNKIFDLFLLWKYLKKNFLSKK